MELKTTYDEWHGDHGEGRAGSACPSIWAVNRQHRCGLTWDRTRRAWVGTPDQVRGLVAAMRSEAQQAAEWAGDGRRGIRARSTRDQARHLRRMADRFEEIVNSDTTLGSQEEER